MKQQVFAVFDNKLGAYMVPFFAPSIGVAVRMFADGVSDPSSQLARHPEDFALMHIGAWDDVDASLTSIVPINLGLAAQYKASNPDKPKAL